MTSCRVPTKTVHWIVRIIDGKQIPVRGPFSNLQDLGFARYMIPGQTSIQTFVYDQFGAVITD